MYVVDSSARKATITLTGEEVAVKFPCTYSVFGIKGDSMLLYPKSGMAQGDDGVYDTAEGDGSVIMCLHYQADTVYIKGSGSCVIWAGNSTLDNPFSSTGKGGGEIGGYEETVLYEMTDYTIPQQTSVTLSDDATNYDSIVVFGIFKSNSSSTNFWRTRARADIIVSQYDFTKELPDTFLLHNSNASASSAGNYCFSDTSTITKTSGDLTWIEKVIGIKYPKLYVPPVSLNQAPVTLLTQQTEEPTDEMW